jgi:NADH-ubiquinone oxidoreductase chain 2
MITISILTLIVAKALPALNTHLSSIHFTRITSIVFLFSGALSLNSLNLESLGSGIGLYSGLFQVTSITQTIELFIFIIGGAILIGWPQIKYSSSHPYLEGKNFTLLLTDKHSTDYSLIVLFSSLGSSLLISSYDLISVYLSI